MRTAVSLLVVGCACFMLLFFVQIPQAGSKSAEDTRVIVAHVGTRAVTLGELEARMATIPLFQLKTFGETPEAIAQKVMEEIVVPETRLALYAEKEKLVDSAFYAYALAQSQARATLRALIQQVGSMDAISVDQVKDYYTQHRTQFHTPARVRLWRILVKTEKEALEVLEQAQKNLTVSNFRALARQHSLDHSNFLRGGDLGWVTKEDASNEAGVRVDPVLIQAAWGVHDGQLVPSPIQEGANFAVVWRRETMKAQHQSLDKVADSIRLMLCKRRVEQAKHAKLEELRAKELSEYHEEPLELLDL